MSFIEFRNVSFGYPRSGRLAVENLSFSLEKGSHTALVGGNGSGKSTLTRLLTGLLIPDDGQILVDGLDTADRRKHRAIRKKAGLMFQDPSTQIVSTVVREDVAFGPENLALDSREIRSHVEDALDAVALTPLAQRETHRLSAGQQQRLAMAGVLAMGSGCLILDEAESMLNPLARTKMNLLLAELHTDGYTILRVTHFMDQAARADEILVLENGRLAARGTPSLLTERKLELNSWRLKLPDAALLAEKLLPDSALLTEEQLAEALSGEKTLGDESFISEASAPIHSKILMSLEGVDLAYGLKSGRPVQALRNINFQLREGESVAVLGKTGSGKSSFLQLLNGLLLPDRGQVSLFGLNPLDKKTDLAALRSRAALVMQQAEKQLFAVLTGDDVAFGPRQAGLKGRELSLRVKAAMDAAGLPFKEFKDAAVKSLSGGQKRRAALAGILAMEPEVLLLDEPTAGLDPLGCDRMEELLVQYHHNGVSLITVTHNVEQALRLAERFVVFSDGEIVYDGDPHGFFRRFDPEELGLEYPLTARVALSAGMVAQGKAERLPLRPDELVQLRGGGE